MLPDRKYDEWSQQDHKDRDYQSDLERRFFGVAMQARAA